MEAAVVQAERAVEKSSERMSEVMGKLEVLENVCSTYSTEKMEDGGQKKQRGYIPQKNKVPDKFEDKVEK